MANVPMVWRFCPNDLEIITYLLLKVIGWAVPCDGFIGADDLYGDKEPWEIFGASRERQLYFFTWLKRMSTNGEPRFRRNIGKGKWNNHAQKIRIRDASNQVVGFKRSFRYGRPETCRRHLVNDDQEVNWRLKEYILSDHVRSRFNVNEEFMNYTLCVLEKDETVEGDPHLGINLDDMLEESHRSLALREAESNQQQGFGDDNGSLRGPSVGATEQIDAHQSALIAGAYSPPMSPYWEDLPDIERLPDIGPNWRH